jgi:hypothetical protein
MAERKIGKDDFFLSRLPWHVRTRRIAIKRLASAGLNKSEIGRVMHRDQTTISYWLRPEFRARKKLDRYKYHPFYLRAGAELGCTL